MINQLPSRLVSQLETDVLNLLGSELEIGVWSRLGSRLGSWFEDSVVSRLWSELEREVEAAGAALAGFQPVVCWRPLNRQVKHLWAFHCSSSVPIAECPDSGFQMVSGIPCHRSCWLFRLEVRIDPMWTSPTTPSCVWWWRLVVVNQRLN